MEMERTDPTNPSKSNKLISHTPREKDDGLTFNVPLKKRKHETKRKYEKKPTKAGLSRGRWVQWEQERFLQGLQIHGRGKWKQISRMIPTRSTIQVKTHAQIVMKKKAAGKNIFDLLHKKSSPLFEVEEKEKKKEVVNKPMVVSQPSIEDTIRNAASILEQLRRSPIIEL